MTLTAAMIVLAIELALAVISVITTRKRASRARRLVRLFGIYSALNFIWAWGLAGADEMTNRMPAGGTWLVILLFALNSVIFVMLHDARERMQYGSYPA